MRIRVVVNAVGQVVQREAASTLDIATGGAAFAATVGDDGIDSGGDGHFEGVDVSTEIEARIPGTHEGSGELRAGSVAVAAVLVLLFLLLLRRARRSGGPLIRSARLGGWRGRALPTLGRGTDAGRLGAGGVDALRLDPGTAAISTRAIEQATDGLVGSVARPLRSGIGASLNGPSGFGPSGVGPGGACPPGGRS